MFNIIEIEIIIIFKVIRNCIFQIVLLLLSAHVP